MALSKTLSKVMLCLLGVLAPDAGAETNIQFVLDISGSMRQKLGNETQLESAIQALSQALGEIPPDGLVAVRVYGHRVIQLKKEESCKDTELLVPFQKLNREAILAKVKELTPLGYTPIAYSLRETRNDLYDVSVDREAERVVVLLTDGEETCGGDPIEVLKQLRAEGFKLKVFTVGFNVNEIARAQLTDIATFTGGKYFDAKDGTALRSALQEATRASVQAAVIDKKKSTYGSAVRGGDSYEDAAPLELNKELKLDHHQKKADFDYFRFEAKRGEKITLELSTLEKGITGVTDGKPSETPLPYAGAAIHNAQRTKVKEVQVIGEPFKRSNAAFVTPADGTYYVLIGSVYSDTNKDQVTFLLKSERLGDAGKDADAGDSPETALPIDSARYPKNFLGDTDKIDMFALNAKKGQRVVVGVIPAANQSYPFYLKLVDEFKQRIFSLSSGSDAGVKSEPIEIPDDGTYYLEVQNENPTSLEYALVVKVDGTAAETPPPSDAAGTQ
jgi:hypothetical protein